MPGLGMALFDGLSLALVIFAGVRALPTDFFAAYVPKDKAVVPRWLTSVGLLLVATFLIVDMLVWLTPTATLGPLESAHPSLTWPAVLIGMGLFFLGSRRARQSRATQGLSDRTRLRILDAIIASSLTSFTLRGPDGTFVYLNETYANTMRSMGIDPDTLVGKKLDDVLPQAGSDQTSENIIESVVRSGTPERTTDSSPRVSKSTDWRIRGRICSARLKMTPNKLACGSQPTSKPRPETWQMIIRQLKSKRDLTGVVGPMRLTKRVGRRRATSI